MTRRSEPLSGAELRRYTRKLGFQMQLVQRSSRKQKSWLDRLVTALLSRAMRPKSAADDFMRDDIVDAGISFSAEELSAYSLGEGDARGEAPGPPAAGD